MLRPMALPHYPTFSRLPTPLRVVFFALTAPLAAYMGFLVSHLTPLLLEATNAGGLTPVAVGLWLLVGVCYSALGLVAGAIAHRLGMLLYRDWFR